jgi:hypothetical protein
MPQNIEETETTRKVVTPMKVRWRQAGLTGRSSLYLHILLIPFPVWAGIKCASWE